jgi:uncharacterized membrane protein YfcA
MSPPWAWALVGLGIFLIGVTKSGFGSGVGLLNVPMLVLAMDYTPGGSEAALGLMLPLLILGDVIAIWQYRKLFAPHIIRHLLPGTLLGVVLGGLLLWWFHRQADLVAILIRLEIGIECVLLVGLHWWRQARGIQTTLLPEPWRGSVTGAFAAVSSTLAHAAGPIIAMYLLPLRLDRQLFVGTCALYFFLLNVAKLPAYAMSGMFERAELPFTLRFAPLVLLGAAAGWWLNRRLSDKAFSTFVYAVTFALGWYLLIDAAVKLARAWT